MQALFGVPMNTIMLVLAALFAVCLAGVALIFLTNRVMFRMGLRNIPRRGAQTSLVVVGLMLATLITTAAFTTGDTVDYSIKRSGYESLQRTDLRLNLLGKDTNAANTDAPVYIKDSATAGLQQKFANDPDIDGFIPLLQAKAPMIDKRSNQSEPSVVLSGVDPKRMSALGGIRLVDGGRADLNALGPNDILLSKRAADKLDARKGDDVSVFINNQPVALTVAGIVKDEIVTSGTGQFFARDSGGGAMLMSSVQKLTGHPGQISALGVALKGDVATSAKNSDAAKDRLEPYLNSDEGRALLGVTNPVSVDTTKADAIEAAESIGNLFTTFFLVLGLFSIAAGIMLIFMIFVMLATERKAEMGMARAVGAQRSNLVQSFISEGMAYSLMAGAVGGVFGVAAALGLVVGFLKISGGFDFIHAHITVRSLVISYCLGVVLTFITVVISSLKVSGVNIVAAIRDTEEDDRRGPRRKISWKWVFLGVPALIIPPLGLWVILRKGFAVAWTWIWAVVFILLGLMSITTAKSANSEFLFGFGVSILPLAVAMIAARLRVNGRLTWTLVGTYLALYWLAPINYAKLILGKELGGNIEMFVLSGVMVVIAFTLIIVYNARLLTVIFQGGGTNRYGATLVLTGLAGAAFVSAVLLGDTGDGLGQLMYLFSGVIAIGAVLAFAAVRFSHLAPALKMGVAYPLSNRFRTGMTIAMFSLIIFSLSTFSALNHSFVQLLTAAGGDGGWDVLLTANRGAGVSDVKAALTQANAPVASNIVTTGRTTVYNGQSQVRQPGKEFKAYPVLAADKEFYSMPDSKLSSWAQGYDNQRAVLDAVQNGTNFAVVDRNVLPGGANDYEYSVDGVTVKDHRFPAFDLEYTDITTHKQAKVTVIGILATQVTSTYTSGVYVSESAYNATFGAPDYLRTYVKLDGKINTKKAAESIEATLVTQGVQAQSIKQLLDESAAESNTFIRMFQGFMALGLLTGVAALGVIAFRSVVERRQQIGMLRAIGYQTSAVALTFAFESGFIALMGILSGVVGGMIVAHNLFTTGQFSSESITFSIPWSEVLLMSGAAFFFSMLMTWWPSQQAARVPVADALRYE